MSYSITQLRDLSRLSRRRGRPMDGESISRLDVYQCASLVLSCIRRLRALDTTVLVRAWRNLQMVGDVASLAFLVQVTLESGWNQFAKCGVAARDGSYATGYIQSTAIYLSQLSKLLPPGEHVSRFPTIDVAARYYRLVTVSGLRHAVKRWTSGDYTSLPRTVEFLATLSYHHAPSFAREFLQDKRLKDGFWTNYLKIYCEEERGDNHAYLHNAFLILPMVRDCILPIVRSAARDAS